MEAESRYCETERDQDLPAHLSPGSTGLVLTAIRSFSWCKQCVAAGRPARGLRAAREYLSQMLLGWDNEERQEVSESDAQLAVLLLEDCVDSLGPGKPDGARARTWAWQEAWKRWPHWDPLELQLQRNEL